MRCCWIVLLLPAGLGAGGADKKAVQAELKRLEGTWVCSAGEISGKPLATGFLKDNSVTFRGDTYTGRLGDTIVEEGTFRIDPTKRPKTIDKTSTKVKGAVSFGIYELDGDTLRICSDIKDRPRFFKTEAGSTSTITTYKRQKPVP